MIVHEILTVQSKTNLDNILIKLCELLLQGQQVSDDAGMVAACIVDPSGNQVYGINVPVGEKRAHAERVAIDRYEGKFGEIPKDSICVTTLSPCTRKMDERYGESCEKLLYEKGIEKVYAGYRDPTQDSFRYSVTLNPKLRKLCKKFADTFLDESYQSTLDEKWSEKYKRSIDCSRPKGFSQRAHCQGRKKK